MDSEHIGKRKHILFYIAGLIFLSFAACASYRDLQPVKECPPARETVLVKEKEICSSREFLHSLAAPGGFEAAIKRNQELFAAFPKKNPGDEALYNLGLVYAHPENPRKDYKKSLGYFKKLVKELPRSSRMEEALIWIGVLEDMERSMKVDIEIEERKKELTK